MIWLVIIVGGFLVFNVGFVFGCWWGSRQRTEVRVWIPLDVSNERRDADDRFNWTGAGL